MASRRLPAYPIRSGFRGWAGTAGKDLRPNRIARNGRQGDAGGRAERARLTVVPNITLTTGSRVDRVRLARQERRRARSAHRRLHYSEWLAGYTFLLPTVVLFALFVGRPILFAIGLSFTNWGGFGAANFTGSANYTRMFNDPVAQRAFVVTILYAVAMTVLQTVIPLVVAVLV